MSILTSHIFFGRARIAQRIDSTYLGYRAPLGHIGSYFALGFLIFLILTKGAEVFVHQFNYKNFVVQYIGIPVYLGCIFGYKLVYKSQRVRKAEADLITDVLTETVADEKLHYDKAQREKADASGQVAIWAKNLSQESIMAVLNATQWP